MVNYLKSRPLILITALAALLRLPTLAIESLWYDEAFTAWLASLPPQSLLTASLNDVHPPTWYLLEWVMVAAFGSSAFTLRVISALAGVALVPMVYRLARGFDLSHPHALAAAALAAVAPFTVYYSQEARAYALVYLLTTVATVALLERRWLLLVISAALATYLHNLAVLYVVSLGWLALYRYKFDWRPLVSCVAIGLLWLPWLLWGLIPQLGDVADGFWVRPPTIGTWAYIFTGWLFSEKSGLLALVTVPIITLALLQSPHMRPDLLGLFLIPVSLCSIASVLFAPVLVGRVVGSSAIILYLLIGPVLIPAPQLRHRLALPTLFAVVLIVFYPLYWGTERIGRYPWHFGLDEFLAQQSPATDGIFHANLATYMVYSYYLPNEQVVWKQANDLSQSLTTETKWAMQMAQTDFEAVACNRQRWWIAFYENPTTAAAEHREINRIISQYNGQLVNTILKNELVNARIYLVEGACQQLTAKH